MTLNKTLSVEEIRDHFPALNRIHNGFPVAYFDGPGGSQVPRSVAEAMTDYLFYHNANTHWAYPTSNETDAIIEDSRKALADFLNASVDEIAFGQNMSSLTFHLGRALGRDFKAGDEIIVTELDHHANSDTWRSLEKDRGVVIRVVPMDIESGTLEFGELEKLFNAKTKLLAIGAASNAIGTISDVKRACQLARANGTLSFVDAVHYAAHNLIDVKDFDCDFLACSAYKFYGPHIGILYGRKELLEKIDFPKLRPAPENSPDRVETGTQSHESIAGAAAAVNFLASLSGGNSRREKLTNTFHEIHSRKMELFKMLWIGLGSIKGVKLYGQPPDGNRTPTLGFTVKDIDSEEVSKKLVERGIFTSHGDFYAMTVIERLGLTEQGLVRIGCACYSTQEEIERLIDCIKTIAN
ncbi:MAG TPA: cysteine desulfurase-like protein [Pyrinomonadaceae bacterium]|nr:cysteine desulfurase-like protein [Pyrinomonadaceae bacterium]